MASNFEAVIQPLIDGLVQIHPSIDTDQVTQIVTAKLTPLCQSAKVSGPRGNVNIQSVTALISAETHR